MQNKQEQWAVLKRLMSYLKSYGLLIFLALSFLLATTVIKSVIPLVASHFIDQYLSNLNQLAVTVLLVLLWSLHPTNCSSVCRQSSLCARVLQYC
ncbi:ABC transporter ATP-binding protein [Streptococcus pneumoniae]|nr:ABC transporter ATP-binding protein [Streptococcus pneumoniae]